MGHRRYPGATPFSSKQANIFYGRDKDIGRLLTLIQVEKKILLYSKSGLGKTSLLEAGVLPKLPKNYLPISIRLFAYKKGAETPVERVIKTLTNLFTGLDNTNDTIIDQLIGHNATEKSLWYYFKKAQLISNQQAGAGSEKIFTLVFDQFEELFTFPKQDIDNFKNQLYELIELKLPDQIARLIAEGWQTDQELFCRENLSLFHKKIEITTVFAIRSDRLSLLNKLSDKIPDIQNTFYELLPLTYEQAQQAIENPANDPNASFETPPFTFHKDAIDKIISELSEKRTENIETTQLQIVCNRIEEIAAAKPVNGPRQIEVKDLPEFKNIFLNFYFDSINRLPEENREDAKRLIEDDLIRNNLRISLDYEMCKKRLKEDELRTLVDAHLLRAEQNTMGRFSYEVSHDTLIEPILDSKKIYSDELERIRLENKQKEELRLIREEQEQVEKERQRKMKQQRNIFIAGTVVLIFLSIFLIYALQQKSNAEKNYENFVKSEFKRNFYEGIAQEDKEAPDFKEASISYQAARSFLDTLKIDELIVDGQKISTRKLDSLIRASESKIPNKGHHEELMRQFENSEKDREYLKAMNFLNDAMRLDYNSKNVQKKKIELYNHAIKVYDNDLKDFVEMEDFKLRDETTIKKNKLTEAFNKQFGK